MKMFEKNKNLFQKVRNLNLPIGEYAIFGGGPMGIRNLKEINDIDIIVSEDLFDELKNNQEWTNGISTNGSDYLFKEEIEIFKDWKPGDWDNDDLIKTAEIIDDLPFVNLDNVIKWKQVYGRDKDLKDIEIIKNFLKNNEN